MFKQLLILFALLLTSCAGFCQGTELDFRIKKPLNDKPESYVISYLVNDYNRQSNSNTSDTFKLYVLPDSKKFWHRPQKPLIWKGGGLPDFEYSNIDFYKTDSLMYFVSIDSTLGEQSFVLGSTTLNQRTYKTYNWYYLATGSIIKYNNYSICTDTNAVISIDNNRIACYKIEGYYKTPWRLGVYREEHYTTTFIAKASLLPVKMIEESSVLQMHMAIHYSAAERRTFKQKKIRSACALNYPTDF